MESQSRTSGHLVGSIGSAPPEWREKALASASIWVHGPSNRAILYPSVRQIQCQHCSNSRSAYQQAREA
jgi:hypothetical protein